MKSSGKDLLALVGLYLAFWLAVGGVETIVLGSSSLESQPDWLVLVETVLDAAVILWFVRFVAVRWSASARDFAVVAPRIQRDLPVAIAAGLAVLVILPSLVEVIASWLSISTESDQELLKRIHQSSSLSFKVLIVIVICTLVPAAEELLYRGSLQAHFESRFGTVPSVVLTSVVFALVHVEPFVVLSAFFSGLVFSISRRLTGSIAAPFLAHCGVNAAVLVSEIGFS